MTNTNLHPNGQTVAYIRISSDTQQLDRQEHLRESVDRVFEEVASASTMDRPVLQAMIAYVRAGDTVLVPSMDRLARNAVEMQHLVDQLIDKGVTVFFQKEGLTYGPDGVNSMSKLLLQIMAAYAEFERAVLKERQAEGIAVAKSKGKYKGRKRALSDEQVAEALTRVDAGVPKAVVARKLGVSRQTLYDAFAAHVAQKVA